jgi:probable phosphoglycerate mutase
VPHDLPRRPRVEPERRRQAERLGELLAGRPFASVLTSPLSRALDTCRLAGLGDCAEPRDELVEWDYGDYEGLTTAEIRAERPGWLLWRDGCPGGETPEQVAARADRVAAELRELDGGAIVFAHGHLLRALAARWLERPLGCGALLGLDAGSVSALGWEREQPVIRLWNAAAPPP